MAQWEEIPGFDSQYLISNDGRVFSRKSNRLLKPRKLSNGYLGIQLGKYSKCHLVHRLVASAFVSGDSSLQVNHLNGKRSDNRAENLEWVTCSDNHRHSYANLHRKQHCHTKKVLMMKPWVELTFPSVLDAAKAFGISPGSLSSAVLRKHKCLGYEVRYV